jgi:hypothetical protein
MAAVTSYQPPAEFESSKAAALQAQEYLQSRLTTTSAAPSFRKIPIIDLTKSFSSSISERQAVAAEISQACTTVGFFYITGHGIPSSLCDGVIKLASRFFHELSPEGREAIHMRNSDNFRGYEPAAFSSVNDFTSKETKDAFNWGYESGLDPTGGDGKYVELDGSPESKKNLWPSEDELPGFYSGVKEYYGQVSLRYRQSLRGWWILMVELGVAALKASFQTLCIRAGFARTILRTNDDPSRRHRSSDPLSTGHKSQATLRITTRRRNRSWCPHRLRVFHAPSPRLEPRFRNPLS